MFRRHDGQVCKNKADECLACNICNYKRCTWTALACAASSVSIAPTAPAIVMFDGGNWKGRGIVRRSLVCIQYVIWCVACIQPLLSGRGLYGECGAILYVAALVIVFVFLKNMFHNISSSNSFVCFLINLIVLFRSVSFTVLFSSCFEWCFVQYDALYEVMYYLLRGYAHCR